MSEPCPHASSTLLRVETDTRPDDGVVQYQVRYCNHCGNEFQANHIEIETIPIYLARFP